MGGKEEGNGFVPFSQSMPVQM